MYSFRVISTHNYGVMLKQPHGEVLQKRQKISNNQFKLVLYV